MQHKIKFINMVITGTIQFKGKSKDQLISELHRQKFEDIECLLSLAMWNLTHDKIMTLNSDLLCQQNQLQTLENTHINDIWKYDLNEIERKLTPQQTEERPHKKRKT